MGKILKLISRDEATLLKNMKVKNTRKYFKKKSKERKRKSLKRYSKKQENFCCYA